MDVYRELAELGFTSNEIKVYLTLIRIGRSQAGRLSKECGIERTSAYNALKRLLEYGIISYVIEANERVFYAGEPEKIIDIFKEKQERASLLIPEIKNLRKYEREKENILKYRGFAGVKTVFNDILSTCKDGDEYLIFGSENQLSEVMPVYAKIYVARKDKKKLRARMLIKETIRDTKKMSKYTQVRYVPASVISPANINVYGNKVVIFLWSETPEAVIIDNKAAADSFRSYFEFMWSHAKK